MMQEKAVRWLGFASLGLVAFASCAGSETPRISDDFEDAIGDAFGNGRTGAAGSGPSGGGRGGSANAGSAGSSSAAGNGGSGSSGECDGFDILKRSCDGENCHGAGTLNGNFAENEEIAAAFVGEAPVTMACSEEGPVINTENPRGSLLIQKVNGTVPCGGAMPLVGQLSEEQVDCLEEWIRDL
jgi:hypothetical protein